MSYKDDYYTYENMEEEDLGMKLITLGVFVALFIAFIKFVYEK